MTDVSQIIITAPHEEWLTAFARELVLMRLTAAAHIDRIRTMYRWNDQFNDHAEWRLTLHTRTEIVPKIIDMVLQQHPYDVPSLVATAIDQGNPAYLDWIVSETAQPTV